MLLTPTTIHFIEFNARNLVLRTKTTCKLFQFSYHDTKRFILFIGFKNMNILIFAIVKMTGAANGAEFDKVGRLEAALQQVPIVKIFLKFHTILVKHQYLKNSNERRKICSLIKIPKVTFLQKLHRSDQFLAVSLKLV